MIEIKNLTKKYGDFNAVDNISFKINDGEIFMEGTPSEVFSHPDELSKISLDIPFFSKLSMELKGISKDVSNVKSMEDLIKVLCQ